MKAEFEQACLGIDPFEFLGWVLYLTHHSAFPYTLLSANYYIYLMAVPSNRGTMESDQPRQDLILSVAYNDLSDVWNIFGQVCQCIEI